VGFSLNILRKAAGVSVKKLVAVARCYIGVAPEAAAVIISWYLSLLKDLSSLGVASCVAAASKASGSLTSSSLAASS
jgi:hypothetical protein